MQHYFKSPITEVKDYETVGGIKITRAQKNLDPDKAVDQILKQIDKHKGALYSSRYEYPGRYSRWDVGFINPPLEIRAKGLDFSIEALNYRGKLLLQMIGSTLCQKEEIIEVKKSESLIKASILHTEENYPEEERSKKPSIFTVIRAIKDLFFSNQDSFLGLYGAFGYDLVFQFEPIEHKRSRSDDSDIKLFLPDQIVVVDHQSNYGYELSYDFQYNSFNTEGVQRTGAQFPVQPNRTIDLEKYQPGRYAGLVEQARERFKEGDMFEVVPSQTLYEKCESVPSEVFERLQQINPSPYGFIINLGGEHLVGSSPEMYVRVEGNRIETCPISGTIKRGKNALEDADQIRKLLNSKKDEEELTMCTDVDRNDKSRICLPGSVKVIGRRQIEMYSHLIHTVDHVEGYLRPEFDALDAFLTHMWAVTVTGAPKKAAINWIEEHEDSPRGWYGGAVGWYSFNGDLNTGLTLRTISLKNQIAEIRVGATLLYDSIPEDEEQETLTKAAGLVKAIRQPLLPEKIQEVHSYGDSKNVLIVDHEDSFVHTLANYFKQTGANVVTYRAAKARELLQKSDSFDLVVLSPGPGKPSRFDLTETIKLCLEGKIPIFGVCLGFQGIVEYFGGKLGLLDYPQHGKTSIITQLDPNRLFEGLPAQFNANRYHSIYAEQLPSCLELTGFSQDEIPMAIEHKHLPITAVQFHPESIGSSEGDIGLRIINNVMKQLEESGKKLPV
ncbi:anthranilate synthase component I [Pseudalkalibacillus salsuginis]|uniref:anthranilate synthase component I n=1 Tax=Pseudalkalibacillus salsuginis TaxID=2910972 RepID=UPI001EFFB8B3|nr:anthranilate synthase component I [Pseudalkalibacillus salsuginis]MCF6411714.1 anthranilate synthase component I [Pseudalkalibacillus salsuginis]